MLVFVFVLSFMAGMVYDEMLYEKDIKNDKPIAMLQDTYKCKQFNANKEECNKEKCKAVEGCKTK